MPDFSAVGKRSRRKGKSYEQEVARLLRRETGLPWMTVRNSGRTDIPGDVFVRDTVPTSVVECKHRQTLDTHAAIKGTKAYRTQMAKVLEDFANGHTLLVFRKDLYGQWVCLYPRRSCYMTEGPMLTDCMGLEWTLYRGFTDDGKRELLARFGPGSTD